ncbi:hypothetical protein ACOTWR_06855 [Aliarcobacter butzleri]
MNNINFNDIKIAYNKPNYVCGHNYYRQRIKITKEILNFIVEKINDKLKDKLAYGDCTMLPEKGKYSEKEYALNISTATFIKSLLPENLQKRFKLDVNSYLYVENGIKETIYFRV